MIGFAVHYHIACYVPIQLALSPFRINCPIEIAIEIAIGIGCYRFDPDPDFDFDPEV